MFRLDSYERDWRTNQKHQETIKLSFVKVIRKARCTCVIKIVVLSNSTSNCTLISNLPSNVTDYNYIIL